MADLNKTISALSSGDAVRDILAAPLIAFCNERFARLDREGERLQQELRNSNDNMSREMANLTRMREETERQIQFSDDQLKLELQRTVSGLGSDKVDSDQFADRISNLAKYLQGKEAEVPQIAMPQAPTIKPQASLAARPTPVTPAKVEVVEPATLQTQQQVVAVKTSVEVLVANSEQTKVAPTPHETIVVTQPAASEPPKPLPHEPTLNEIIETQETARPATTNLPPRPRTMGNVPLTTSTTTPRAAVQRPDSEDADLPEGAQRVRSVTTRLLKMLGVEEENAENDK